MGFGMINSYGKTGYYAKQAFETATNAKETADEALELAEEAIERVEARVIKVLPAQDGTLTYDGTEQTVTWKNVTPGSLTFGGVQSATNAGSYTATCKPTKSYKWEDGTVGEKNIVWTIDRQAIYDVPSQTGAIVYDGTEKSPTWENYDTDKMTIGGTTTGTDVGSYNAAFTPKANYKWQDGSVDAKTVAWSIVQELLIVPAQSGTLTFDGTEKTPVLDSNYDPSLMTLSGDTAATNAGTYTLTVSLTDATNYRWEDGTATSKTVSWTIGRSVIGAVPSQDGTLTYTGNAQTVSWANYNPAQLTLDGTTVGTDAGTYTAVFTPKSNYIWSDASGTDAKNVTWEIGKAAGAVTLSKDSITLDTSTLTDTFTYTRLGDGAVTVTSSDLTKATVSDSCGTVTVTAVASGSATVTVSVAAGTNYLAASATVSVAVQLISNVLDENSWATISQVAQAGTGDTYWDIGDCKEITLNGKVGDYLTLSNQKLCVYILGFNHKDNNVADNNIIFGGFKSSVSSGTDVALVDSRYGSGYMDGSKCFNMNHKGQDTSGQPGYRGTNYGGWKGSDLRYDILGATSTQPSQYNQSKTSANVGYDASASTLTSPKADTFLAALPSDLRAKLRLWTRWVDAVGNSSNVDANIKATVDAVTLLAEPEIFASRAAANQYEYNHNTRMAYYTAGNSTIKKKHSDGTTAATWWECSPARNSASNFAGVNTGGGAGGNTARNAYGLAPAFKV